MFGPGSSSHDCNSTGWRQPPSEVSDVLQAIESCRALVSTQEADRDCSAADEAVSAYRRVPADSLDEFFTRLVGLTTAEPDRHAEPTAARLFRRLNAAGAGAATLADMRRQILRGLGSHADWAVLETDLSNVIQSSFTIERLEFRRIDAGAPAALLEYLVKFESVHEIKSQWELLRRLQADRRCYGFFHPAMPDEPVAFVELALTQGLTASVHLLLDPDSPILDAGACTHAVFYSISSCHRGLRGVSFGNALIRRTVEHLRREWPGLQTFATLSPIPGFRSWLTASGGEHRTGAEAIARLDDSVGLDGSRQWDELKAILIPLCASYLLRTKRGAEPADPVARFHLRNGACLERLNWRGDTSAAGLARSVGVTANYVYRLDEMDRNQAVYANERRVIASPVVEQLLDAPLPA
jgi:malonyl-CoA decarboxylase